MHEPLADSPSRHPNSQSSRRRSGGRLLRPVAIVLVAAVAVGLVYWRYQAQHAASDQTSANGGAAGAGGGGSMRRNGAGGSMRQPVSVQTARIQDLRVTASAIGTIAAANTAVVHAQVTGTLQRILFREGQQVHAGDQLAQIDARAIEAQVSQAEGALARDQAQLDNARIDLARYQNLVAKDAIPEQQLATQQALVHQLEGTVVLDRGALDAARLQVLYTRVIAPISGRVGLKQVDLGNVVQPSDANGIVSIAQTMPAALVFSVPAALIPQIVARLNKHQPLKVHALDRGTGAELAAGLVDSLDNTIDPTTDTVKVKALFPNRDNTLFPNQSVSVLLELETLKNVLTVPQAAVLRGAQGAYLYVVNDDQSVATHVITPGAVDGDWMAVTGDVAAGQTIVIDGVDRLRNGARVEVIQPATGHGKTGNGGAGNHAGHAAAASAPASAAAGAVDAAHPASHASQPVSASADQGAAADSSDSDRRAFFQGLTPEDREKFRALSPEQKRAWRTSGHPPAAQ